MDAPIEKQSTKTKVGDSLGIFYIPSYPIFEFTQEYRLTTLTLVNNTIHISRG